MFGLGISTLISVVAGVLVAATPARATTVAFSSGFANSAVTIDCNGPTSGALVANS